MICEERVAGGEMIITRREALKMGALALSAPAIAMVLAGCHDHGEGAAKVRSSGKTSTDAGMITFSGPRGQLKGSFAAATTPRGAVLVIHDDRGLTPHFVALTGRLAESGYSALSVDLLSGQGGTAAVGSGPRARQILTSLPTERLLGDLGASLDELSRRTPKHKAGVIGFSFGAEMVWRLLDEPRLAAAIPVCGRFPDGLDLAGAKAAVLGMYAENDAAVNATREAGEAALVLAGAKYESKLFLGVDSGFFDETGPGYDKRAADAAYSAVLDWFRIHLD